MSPSTSNVPRCQRFSLIVLSASLVTSLIYIGLSSPGPSTTAVQVPLSSQKASSTAQSYVSMPTDPQEPYSASRPRPDTGNRNISILFLNTFEDYTRRMSRFFYDLVDTAFNDTRLNVTVWGPGWIGYNSSVSESENIALKFGCGNLDIIYHEIFRPVGCGKTVVVQQLGDCHHGACQESYNKNAHVVITRYAFIPIELFYMNLPKVPVRPQMFAHNPDCSLFEPPSHAFSNRTEDALLIGKLAPNFYPLRTKIYNGIKHGVIPGKFFQHPGYRTGCNLTEPSEPYSPFSDLSIQLKHNSWELSRALQNTRICLFDSSVVRKAIRKFMEAMMSGCVVASDLPFEMEEELRDVVIELHASDSPWAIGQKIRWYLDRPAVLEDMSQRALAIARRMFTCQHKLDRVLQYVQEYRNGFRGYYFPYGFRLGCHSYTGKLKRPNRWCPKN